MITWMRMAMIGAKATKCKNVAEECHYVFSSLPTGGFQLRFSIFYIRCVAFAETFYQKGQTADVVLQKIWKKTEIVAFQTNANFCGRQ